jgi:diguanylate cyclase (GGDEF)-like protein/PAS domain S-box-containing protein
MNGIPMDELYRSILDSIQDGVYFVDQERRITFWNKGAERLTGYTAAEMVGSRCLDNLLAHVDQQGCQLCVSDCPLSTLMRGDEDQCEAEVFLHHRNGQRIPVLVRAATIKDATGANVGAVEVFSDNSLAMNSRSLIDELKQAALLDPLTGIANRRFLDMKLEQTIADLGRYGTPSAVLLLDIDRFKEINDTYGHPVGDRVLRMVAETLRTVIRGTDMAGRLGGDEFLVVATHLASDKLAPLTEKLRRILGTSFLMVEDRKVSVTTSFGATMAREDDTAHSLLERADRLLYQAKHAGRNCSVTG